MDIKIIKNNNIIELKNNDNVIESYNLTNSIDFNKLMSFLIKDELNNKINLINENLNLSDQEKSLCKLIKTIIDNYNNKVDDFIEFSRGNDLCQEQINK